MSMKITKALDFQFLYQKLKDQPINIKLAYKLNKLNSRLLQEVEFYRLELTKILEEYAKKDENGEFILNEDKSGYLLKESTIKECYDKIGELQALEIEDLDIKFSLDELDGLAITPIELQCLEDLIIE